jgi:hypothetical protein
MSDAVCSVLKLYHDRVLSGVSGPRRGEVSEGRRKLHNEELLFKECY